MSVHQTPDGRWFCKFHEDGKERRRYFGRGDVAQQQAMHADFQVKERKGKIKIEGGLSVMDICVKYHSDHPVQGSTRDSDFYRLDKIILPLIGTRVAEELTSNDLNEYVSKRLAAGRKRRTIDRELDILRSAFSWAQAQDPPLIIRNPIAKFRIPNADDSDVPAPPTLTEISAILKHAPQHLARAIMLGWSLGIRPGGEIQRIQWWDVDLESDKIKITSARKGGPSIRFVPIPDRDKNPLKGYLEAWKAMDAKAAGKTGLEIGGIPVVHYGLKPVKSVKTAWESAKKRAGIKRRLRLYDLRHAMATYALEAGADLKATSELLGHSRADTTLRHYQHIVKGQHRRVVDLMPPIPGHHLVTNLDSDQ